MIISKYCNQISNYWNTRGKRSVIRVGVWKCDGTEWDLLWNFRTDGTVKRLRYVAEALPHEILNCKPFGSEWCWLACQQPALELI